MKTTRLLTLACVLALLVGTAGDAQASELVGYNAGGAGLSVIGGGAALATFRSEGQLRQVVASGAINALAPNGSRAQVKFSLRRTSGVANGTCGRYDGPALQWLVAACKAPDGSYWALQSWRRLLPNFGLPASGIQAAAELRLSHWRGPIAELVIKTDWSYAGRFDHLFGTYSYLGKPIFGFRSTRWGSPLDTYGRNIYVDTYNSAYGRGWKRENSFLAHRPLGTFCYGFYNHGARPIGRGTAYRATAIGPGVTPDVFWQGRAPGRYSALLDAQLNLEQLRLLRGDPLCRPN